jgi:hypothetical protein
MSREKSELLGAVTVVVTAVGVIAWFAVSAAPLARPAPTTADREPVNADRAPSVTLDLDLPYVIFALTHPAEMAAIELIAGRVRDCLLAPPLRLIDPYLPNRQ